MRERIGEELDYELEAQNQRRIERLLRGHPFVRVPRVHTSLSTRRVLVSEYVEGERFEAVQRADEAPRDRYGEIVFRLYFGLLYRDRIALGDPHPGNYLLCPDGRVCFMDFGLLRDVDAARVAAERAIAAAARERDADALKAALLAGGYLPASRADGVDADFALSLMRMAIKWYAVPGERRFSPVDRRDRDREQPDAQHAHAEDRLDRNEGDRLHRADVVHGHQRQGVAEEVDPVVAVDGAAEVAAGKRGGGEDLDQLVVVEARKPQVDDGQRDEERGGEAAVEPPAAGAGRQRRDARDPGHDLEQDLDGRERPELQATLTVERNDREQPAEADRRRGGGVDARQGDAARERRWINACGV
jgi:tRNA A-37 threonylcarbamoyl transferase component Bud32